MNIMSLRGTNICSYLIVKRNIKEFRVLFVTQNRRNSNKQLSVSSSFIFQVINFYLKLN